MRKHDKVRTVAIALKFAGASGRDLLNGISTYAHEHCHWRFRIFSRTEDFTPEALAEIRDLGGIITSERGADGMMEVLENSRVPLVVIGMKGEWLTKRTHAMAFVRNDDEDIGRFAANHLSALGNFRSFGFVPSAERTYWSLLRQKGFRSFLRTKGISTSVFPAGTIGTNSAEPALSLPAWLQALPKPAAIMAAFDERAVEVLNACNEAKIDVPRQVAVIGVDNDELLCDFSDPPLTSVLPDHVREGALAASELNRLLKAKKPTGTTTVLCRGKRIIRRESTAPVAPMTHLVDEALSFIRRNATADIRVIDVARHLGVSRRLADLRFRESGETSIARVIAKVRLDEVAKRLRNSNAPIGKIASACSFDNHQHLANAFRRQFGLSMSAYRARAKSEAHGTPLRGSDGGRPLCIG